jgi:hypothetical protein
MIDNIIFFHNHVNGDSVMSRILIKQIIDYTKNSNIQYFYTAQRSFDSYCIDLGINKENFNTMKIPNNFTNKNLNVIDNNLYIDVWIGHTEVKCCFCMINIIEYYNEIIKSLNNQYNFSIEYIKQQNPFIKFNYDYYNCIKLKDYIISEKNKYNKIVCIYNILPTTFITLRNINFENIIISLSKMYEDYLFITFNNIKTSNNNIISFKYIYNNLYNKDIINYSIQFSYLSLFCDNIIGLLSGICQVLFNDCFYELSKNITIIYDISEHTPENTPLCVMYDNTLCTKKNNLLINCYKYKNDNNLLDYLELFLTNINNKKKYLDKFILNYDL